MTLSRESLKNNEGTRCEQIESIKFDEKFLDDVSRHLGKLIASRKEE
ncbi:hypothetical protein [Fusibacter sp. JL216-2]